MIVIGEKINGTRSEVARAVKERDGGLIKNLALAQVEAGADYLDVNAGTHPDREPDDMIWLVETIQTAADVGLCLDSANPRALEAGIKAARRLPLINSLSGEKQRLEGVLPLIGRYRTPLVILALDDQGIPASAGARLAIVERLILLAREQGLTDDLLFIDPLVTTIATDNNSGVTALEVIRQIKAKFPEVHITCGLSNISFGQPSRTLINQAFAALAIGAGLDCAIIDPGESGLRGIIHSAEMVMGLDPDCLRYNQAHRDGRIGTPNEAAASNGAEVSRAFWSLFETLKSTGLIRGEPAESMATAPEQASSEASGDLWPKELIDSLVGMKKARVNELTQSLLDGGTDPLAILDASKEAMAEVGRLFEAGEYFVPELILAGKMLKDIAETVKPRLAGGKPDQEKKGRVIIGTVQGDIHDIGKDIVVTMLEVNGYEVMDLGVDVPVDRFVEAAREFRPAVIGLSGFLTLAYDPMKESIAAVKQENLGDIKFMIGGGQIDEQVLVHTGADAFGRDAMEAVKLCRKWISAL